MRLIVLRRFVACKVKVKEVAVVGGSLVVD